MGCASVCPSARIRTYLDQADEGSRARHTSVPRRQSECLCRRSQVTATKRMDYPNVADRSEHQYLTLRETLVNRSRDGADNHMTSGGRTIESGHCRPRG
ncbi:hypothetical protein BCEP4_490005 [Burkholderia cepacia]|nr:hypothetical protein BCEP4_490005 [Burkholderia cepacia]